MNEFINYTPKSEPRLPSFVQDENWQDAPEQAYLYVDEHGNDYIATADGKTVEKWEDVLQRIFG